MANTSKPSIVAVLEALDEGFRGLQDYGGWKDVKCAFHGDRHASARYNPDEGQFHCFACGIQGDAYDVIEKVEGVGFAEAKRRAEAITGEHDGGLRAGSGARVTASKLPAWTRDRNRRRKALSAGRGGRLVSGAR